MIFHFGRVLLVMFLKGNILFVIVRIFHIGRVWWSWWITSNCEGKGFMQLASSTSPSSTWSFGSRVVLVATTSSSSLSHAFADWLVSSLSLLFWPSWGGWLSWQTVPPPRASTLLTPVVLATDAACCSEGWALPMAVSVCTCHRSSWKGFSEKTLSKHLFVTGLE